LNLHSIRTQVALLAILPATLIALVLGFYFTSSRLHDAERVLADQGNSAIRHLAAAAEFPLATGNLAQMEKLLASVGKEANVEFAQIRDPQGKLTVSTGDVPMQPSIIDILGKDVVRSDGVLIYTRPIWLVPAAMKDLYLGDSPAEERRRLGWVVVGLSTRGLEASRRQMLLGGLLMTFLVLAGTYVVALLFGSRLSAPLHTLARTVEELGKGNLDARADTRAYGEVRQLGEGVNEMAVALQRATDGLYQRIREATASLAAQKETAEKANAEKSRFLAATSRCMRWASSPPSSRRR
jgi:methyl-accepting chemotaxis protein